MEKASESTMSIPNILNKYRAIIISLGTVLLGIILLGVGIFVEQQSYQAPIWAEFVKQLGTIFVPSGVISFVYEYALRRNFLEEMNEQLLLALQQQFASVSELQDAGLRHIHKKLPIEKIVEDFANSKNTITILQTWLPDIVNFEQAFISALNNGSEIKVLLLDPLSEYAKQRSKDLGYSDPNYASNIINANIAHLQRFNRTRNALKKIEVRLYDALPSLQIYSCDQKKYIGFFYHGEWSTQMPTLEISDPKSLLGRNLEDEFLKVWSIAKPIENQVAEAT